MAEWQEVSDAELREIWSKRRFANRIFNGCTFADLQERYGAENVRRSAEGWEIRIGEVQRQGPASTSPTSISSSAK